MLGFNGGSLLRVSTHTIQTQFGGRFRVTLCSDVAQRLRAARPGIAPSLCFLGACKSIIPCSRRRIHGPFQRAVGRPIFWSTNRTERTCWSHLSEGMAFDWIPPQDARSSENLCLHERRGGSRSGRRRHRPRPEAVGIEPDQGTDPPFDSGPSLGGYDELRPADARPPIVTRNTTAASHVQKLSGMASPNKVFTAQMNTRGQSTTNGIPTAMMRNMA